MRRLMLLLPLVAVACGDADSRTSDPPQAAVQSNCERKSFEGSRMTVCEAGGMAMELFAAARNETPVRNFTDLESALGRRSGQVAFAMNAGMYGEDGRPIGLAIVNGRQVRAINRRRGGGNFHLIPTACFRSAPKATRR